MSISRDEQKLQAEITKLTSDLTKLREAQLLKKAADLAGKYFSNSSSQDYDGTHQTTYYKIGKYIENQKSFEAHTVNVSNQGKLKSYHKTHLSIYDVRHYKNMVEISEIDFQFIIKDAIETYVSDIKKDLALGE